MVIWVIFWEVVIFDGRKMVEVRDWGVFLENSFMLLEDGLVRVISNVLFGEEKI